MSIIPPLNNENVVKWHPKLNNTPTPSTVTSRKNWWVCNKNHEFSAKTKNKNSTPTCPTCSFKTTLPGFNDLQTLNPKLAAQWHPTRNGKLTPTQVNPKSTKKVWWLGECGHEWETTINSRAIPHKTTKTTTNCPYCAGTKLLPGFNDLSTTNPEIAKLWHPTLNGELTPNQISKNNKTKVWWLGECGHEWERPTNRQIQHQCPVCTGHSLQPGVNDLQTLYPEIAKLWHPTKTVNSHQTK